MGKFNQRTNGKTVDRVREATHKDREYQTESI
jgi:hypothetical protein